MAVLVMIATLGCQGLTTDRIRSVRPDLADVVLRDAHFYRSKCHECQTRDACVDELCMSRSAAFAWGEAVFDVCTRAGLSVDECNYEVDCEMFSRCGTRPLKRGER